MADRYSAPLRQPDRAEELLEGERERPGCASRVPGEDLSPHATEHCVVGPQLARASIGIDHPMEWSGALLVETPFGKSVGANGGRAQHLDSEEKVPDSMALERPGFAQWDDEHIWLKQNVRARPEHHRIIALTTRPARTSRRSRAPASHLHQRELS